MKTRKRNKVEFYEGQPCKKCEHTTRQVHDNRCVFCLKQRQLIYNDKLKERNFMQKHGCSFTQRDKMYVEQNGKCLICKEKGHIDILSKGAPTTGRLVVDHCHKTGKIRGLICNACNIGLGVFKDDIQLLLNACEYLETRG